MITLVVLGTPAPKGSARAFMNRKTGRAFVAPGGAKSTEKKIANWNTAMREAAREAVGDVTTPPFVDQALAVAVTFWMARPASHWGKGKNAGKLAPAAPAAPRGKPDVDKLVRATLDPLTGIVFDDDSRIVELRASKRYATPGHEGATITVAVWGE